MKELAILLAPIFWSVKNDIVRFNWSFYRKIAFYFAMSGILIVVVTSLLSMGMGKLQNLSPEVFQILLVKGYSLIFIIIFFMQIINGFAISLNTYFQATSLEMLLTSPVSRSALFFSRLFETHLKASWMLVIFGIPLLLSSGFLYHANILYYFYAVLIFTAFSAIPTNIGIGLSILFSRVFNTKKLKKYLLTIGIVSVVLLVTLLRLVKPERFVNPELFANLTLFISALQAPSFILLPNRWLIETIFNFLQNDFSTNTAIFLSLLILTLYISTLFLFIIFKRYYYEGWENSQEGEKLLIAGRQGVSQYESHGEQSRNRKRLARLLGAINVQSRTFIQKDLFYQTRDIRNLHQLLILFSLIAVYLFSISSLPLDWEYYNVQLKYLVAFFNLGIILFILASLCARIICPAIMAEATTYWLIKTLPITSRRYVWTKFFYFFFPILLVGQILIVTSSVLINIDKTFLFMNMTVVAALSLSLVSIAISFAIGDMKAALQMTSADKMKTGNTVYMILAIFLILFTLTAEAFPSLFYLFQEQKVIVFTKKTWATLLIILFGVIVVNILITFGFIQISVRKFGQLEGQ